MSAPRALPFLPYRRLFHDTMPTVSRSWRLVLRSWGLLRGLLFVEHASSLFRWWNFSKSVVIGGEGRVIFDRSSFFTVMVVTGVLESGKIRFEEEEEDNFVESKFIRRWIVTPFLKRLFSWKENSIAKRNVRSVLPLIIIVQWKVTSYHFLANIRYYREKISFVSMFIVLDSFIALGYRFLIMYLNCQLL